MESSKRAARLSKRVLSGSQVPAPAPHCLNYFSLSSPPGHPDALLVTLRPTTLASRTGANGE